MRIRTTGALVLLAGLFAASGHGAPSERKTVTLYVPKGVAVDVANRTIVVTNKLAGETKLGKACAGSNGKFARWRGMVVDPSGNHAPSFVDVVAGGIPGKGGALTSLHSEGECQEGAETWQKFSAVLNAEKGP